MKNGAACRVVTLAALSLLAPGISIAASLYELIDTKAAYGMEAHAINNHGVVAGSRNQRAVTWTNGVIVEYGTLGGFYSNAWAINDRGDIAGDSDTTLDPTDYRPEAFAVRDGSMVGLGHLQSGSISVAQDINDVGQVVGFGIGFDGSHYAFLYDFRIPQGTAPGTLIDLGTLGGNGASAYGINEVGQVAGVSEDATGARRAFVHNGSRMIDVGTLGGTSSAAFDMNLAGEVIGESLIAGDLATHAFISNGPTMIDLGTLGGSFSSGKAINRFGMAVGESTDAGGNSRAFLFDGTTMLDLNSLIDSTLGIVLKRGDAINDRNAIIASGTDASGQDTTFLLRPTQVVPLPASLYLLAGALGMAGCLSRRRRA